MITAIQVKPPTIDAAKASVDQTRVHVKNARHNVSDVYDSLDRLGSAMREVGGWVRVSPEALREPGVLDRMFHKAEFEKSKDWASKLESVGKGLERTAPLAEAVKHAHEGEALLRTGAPSDYIRDYMAKKGIPERVSQSAREIDPRIAEATTALVDLPERLNVAADAIAQLPGASADVKSHRSIASELRAYSSYFAKKGISEYMPLHDSDQPVRDQLLRALRLLDSVDGELKAASVRIVI